MSRASFDLEDWERKMNLHNQKIQKELDEIFIKELFRKEDKVGYRPRNERSKINWDSFPPTVDRRSRLDDMLSTSVDVFLWFIRVALVAAFVIFVISICSITSEVDVQQKPAEQAQPQAVVQPAASVPTTSTNEYETEFAPSW